LEKKTMSTHIYDQKSLPARSPRRQHEISLDAVLCEIVREFANRAPWAPDLTADRVGLSLIKSLLEMHPGALHVIALVGTILASASKR
jgi:hypothetical protein